MGGQIPIALSQLLELKEKSVATEEVEGEKLADMAEKPRVS